jgi:hypothetical protein
MKVLLRKISNSHYYVGTNRWTNDPKQARDFDQVDRAIQFHQDEKLTGVEVVLTYDDPFCDLVLPLGSLC